MQENLARGLSVVSRAVSSRSTLPVLGNVLLKTEDAGLKLTATNLEIGITCWIPGRIEIEGATTIPARLLTDLVGTLPASEKVELELRIASAGTGFKATSAVQGVKLFVDGTEIGPLPQTLTTLSPGDHKLRFDAGDRYKPEEKTVTVTPDKIEDLGDIKLIVAKGKATLELVTRGARILLVPSSGEKRLIDERMFANNQLSVEIDTSKEWRIEASKASFDDLNLPISFTDGQAEKTFRIELHETGKATAAADTAKATTGAPTTTAAPSDTGKPATTAPAAAGGQAKLNINSMPPSAVLVDGRPVGRTPRSGLVVTPGTHNVTFIHPEKGRKSASVTVGPGETKGVGVRF